MPITISAPAPAPLLQASTTTASDSEDEMDLDLDPSLPPTSTTSHTILTPGTPLTTDNQFMRGHGTYHPSSSTSITSSLLGTLLRTNKLLSILPLSARYTPEIGDLVVGRIVSVQSRRWKVDISSTQLANLPLSAINLPGGTLRRRTGVDELNMRSYFSEGDLVVAEVQTLFGDGSAGLHTRSLKYGKLRNGGFVDVGGGKRRGTGGGVKRSKRQIFNLGTRAGELDVVVGVNGFVFVAMRTAEERREGTGMGLGARGEDEVEAGKGMYSAQNDEVGVALRGEIVRVLECVRALAQGGVNVDEDMIRRAYDAALEVALTEGPGDERPVYLGDEAGRVVADMAMAAAG